MRCLRSSNPIVFGSTYEVREQLRAVPWSTVVVCGDDRSQFHRNDICDRVTRFPATMVHGHLFEGFQEPAKLEQECRRLSEDGAPLPPRPTATVCNVPRRPSRFPTGSFLGGWSAHGGSRAFFGEVVQGKTKAKGSKESKKSRE